MAVRLSTTSLNPSLFLWGGHSIVYDHEGRLWDQTAAHRRSRFQNRIARFDFDAQYPDSIQFNVLKSIRKDGDADWVDATQIASVLINPHGEERHGLHTVKQHWGEMECACLAALIIYALYKTPLNATLMSVHSLLTDSDNKAGGAIFSKISRLCNNTTTQGVRRALTTAEWFLALPLPEREAIIARIRNALEFSRAPQIAETIAFSSFQLADFRDNDPSRAITLYLTTRENDAHTPYWVYRHLIMDMLIFQLRSDTRGLSEPQVCVFGDDVVQGEARDCMDDEPIIVYQPINHPDVQRRHSENVLRRLTHA